MNEPGPRFWTIFFEIFGDLPRQGPGDRASAVRALELCRELPRAPAIVDLGCGLAAEPETHRRHAAFYAYEFFVARRPAQRIGGPREVRERARPARQVGRHLA